MVILKEEQDVFITIIHAFEHIIRLLPRGGETSFIGQAVGESNVWDFLR